MVRFGWHVEDGLGAHILPGEMSAHEKTGISHATCSIEVRHGRCRRECQTCHLAVPTTRHNWYVGAQVAEDKQPLQAIFTLPPHYLQHDHVRNNHLAYRMDLMPNVQSGCSCLMWPAYSIVLPTAGAPGRSGFCSR